MDNVWDERFLRQALQVASWSKDPSTQVGAVVVWPDKRFVCGYNGFPRGMNDSDELYANRDEKIARTMHAEENAILNARGDVSGCTIYTTHPPCTHCACVIIQSGIKRVVYVQPNEDFLSRWGEHFNKSNEFFWEVGISTVGIEINVG